MKKIRIGNDIQVLWEIFTGENENIQPYNIEGKNLSLYIRTAFKKIQIREFSVNGNKVEFTIWGKDQKHTGRYSLTLIENEGLQGMHSVDECDAFCLVRCSCEAGGEEESRVDIVSLQLKANMMLGGGIVDDELSETSTNAVQNKVITKALKDTTDFISYDVSLLGNPVYSTSDMDGYSQAQVEAAFGMTFDEVWEKLQKKNLMGSEMYFPSYVSRLDSMIQFFYNAPITDSHAMTLAIMFYRTPIEVEEGISVSMGIGQFETELGYDDTGLHGLIAEKQDTLVSGENIKTINNESILGSGNIDINLRKITYAELVALRDSAGLIPGMQYRITDYITTTKTENTQSAGHAFDVIVTADDKSTLNEKARAIQHEGDEYFANSDLAAWEIWYCLDNDTERFDWADAENGKGVIYRMIDEFRNDIPYDFKNIIYVEHVGFRYFQWGRICDFRRNSEIDKVIDEVQYYGWTSADTPPAWSEPNCWTTTDAPSANMSLYKADGSQISYGGTIESIISEYSEKFTFNADGADASLRAVTHDNIVPSYLVNGKILLNNILFGDECYSNTFGSYCYSNTFGNNCYSNTFGNNCYSNSLGNNCYSNTFGDDSNSNTFRGNCRYNTFGNNCYSNSLGNNCYSNTFGDNDYSNSLGNNCYSNTFGDECNSNTFGGNCRYNTFGSYCYSNTFGEDCYSNTFGHNCGSNTFGDGCDSNTFGNNCYSNSLGNNCDSNTFGNNCDYNTFGDGCDSNTFGDECQGFKILLGGNLSQMSHVKLLGKNTNLYINNPAVTDLAPQNVIVMPGVGGATVNVYKQDTAQIVYSDADGNVLVAQFHQLIAQ